MKLSCEVQEHKKSALIHATLTITQKRMAPKIKHEVSNLYT